MNGKGNPHQSRQEVEFLSFYQMVYAKTRISCKNTTCEILWDCETRIDLLIQAKRPYLEIINKKKENM